MIGGDWRGLWEPFKRSWVHATGAQLAALATLSSAYAVLAFALAASLNLKQVLSSFGESVEITAYVAESEEPGADARVADSIGALPDVESIERVSKEQAAGRFRAQMANYAPDLLNDKDFEHPFPASVRARVRADSPAALGASALDGLAAQIRGIAGVEDVSYGQTWIANYATLVKVSRITGWALAATLGAGALFTIGNAIRASVGQRREEIEILELVGATASMIRAPYVFEGAMMGFIAAAIALGLNFAAWTWERELLRESFSASRLLEKLSFLPIGWSAGALALGSSVGALGAYAVVRSINDGWAASNRAAEGGAEI